MQGVRLSGAAVEALPAHGRFEEGELTSERAGEALRGGVLRAASSSFATISSSLSCSALSSLMPQRSGASAGTTTSLMRRLCSLDMRSAVGARRAQQLAAQCACNSDDRALAVGWQMR